MNTKEDFLMDPEFIAWTLHPNDQLNDYWVKWMDANPEQVRELKLAREVLLRSRYKEYKAPEGMKEDIRQKLLTEKSTEYINEKKSYRWLFNLAAMLLIGFTLVWLSGIFTKDLLAPVEEALVMLHKNTGPGEKLQLTLPDGTRVWLNSNSEISFPEKFGSVERKVRLAGEAFIEVEKDSLRPFKVEAQGLVTTALGTSFNIKEKGEAEISISLVTGKVKVENVAKREDFFLSPGEQLHRDPVTGKKSIRKFDRHTISSWKEGTILFQKSNLEEVVTILENWYGVKIEVENSTIANWEFSGEYHRQSLENVLKSMGYVQNFEFELNGKNVTIKIK
ncbi:FecR family protein [Cyclobacterium marinum]|uniref:Anti-FecI sigma factor, FecR n=1 Tax=Cyclobacterium marinum (strain ATCC 25205 / DSM 745 / LMG 13164 / NCIMB 1802) TaxID=880070 RepID=G0J070_CYCMS|nr:FecR family protein [Cyclobacterium marinum]AEL27331.1 anti-FecI sigma factor, FecR [Cyclobacterium marinum DSM 745]